MLHADVGYLFRLILEQRGIDVTLSTIKQQKSDPKGLVTTGSLSLRAYAAIPMVHQRLLACQTGLFVYEYFCIIFFESVHPRPLG